MLIIKRADNGELIMLEYVAVKEHEHFIEYDVYKVTGDNKTYLYKTCLDHFERKRLTRNLYHE